MKEKYLRRKKGEHLFAECGGIHRCVTCGCDEDDAFVGGENCTFPKKKLTEKQRRDEKHGLYGNVLDVAN